MSKFKIFAEKINKISLRLRRCIVGCFNSSGAVTPAAPGALKNNQPDLSKLTTEELEIMALNKLIEMGALDQSDAQLYWMTGEISDTLNITQRIIDKYGK